MNKTFTGFTASGLLHPDYGDSVGEQLRRESALTASLLEFMTMAFEPERPEHIRLMWDVLNVAAARAIALTEALDGVEIMLPPAQRLAASHTDGGADHA
ncbi:hypothetical protein [Enterobacter ludwigii]|uniref:hypothetical protein n=1 Tax=Enterobacter ludwigii TaxID=299767 RepID=UPI00064293E4|nr:hypothetical protein [Enterobacter ludwigii]KLP35546.1 hypothetical protein ABR36_18485 [Enterobacter ludwigii]